MRLNHKLFAKLLILSGLLCVLSPASRADSAAFNISIDTSTLTALGSGYIDIELNPGANDALPLIGTLYNAETDGILDPADTIDTGAATGALGGAGLPQLVNSTFFNDIFEPIVFGDSIDFDVCFCGSAINGDSITGSTFSVGIYGPDGFTPQLTASQDGSLLHIDVNPPDGDVISTVFADSNNAMWATVTEIDPNCPEPSTLVLAALGLAFPMLRAGRMKKV